MAQIKGKQVQDTSLDLEKLRGGTKILPNTATLGTTKTVAEITNAQEFTTTQFVTSYINAASTAASVGLASEITRATAAELALSNAITAEASTRGAVNTFLQNLITSSIAAEASTRGAADQSIINNLTTLINNGLTAEASTRGQVDAYIISQLTSVSSASSAGLAAEIARATQAESDITDAYTQAISSAIDTELNRAEAAETALDTRLTSAESTIASNSSSISTINGNLAAEISRAEGAESTLQSHIDTVQANVVTEAQSRASADSTEATARANGDATNATDISNEETRATNAEQAILDSVGAASGIAPLGSDSKIPSAYLPDSILGNVSYISTWDASGGTEPAVASSTNKGNYYIITVAGTIDTIDFQIGDWIISDGTQWDKVDNSDAVTTVFGRAGNIVAADGDYTASQITFVPGTSGLVAVTSQDAIIELANDLATEVTDRTNGDNTNATAISNEIDRATTAEGVLSGRLDTAETNISNNTSDISSLTGRVSTAEGNITTNAQAIADESSRATAAEGTISSDLSSLTSRVTTAEGDIITLQSDMSTAQASITTNANAISSETTRAEGVESGLDSRLTTAEGDISTNATAISSETTRAEGVESGLDSRLTTAEGDISTNANAISSETTRAEGVESGLDSRLTTAEGDISTNATAISSETTRAEGVESGLQTQIDSLTSSSVYTEGSGIDITSNTVSLDITNYSTVNDVQITHSPDGQITSELTINADEASIGQFDYTGLSHSQIFADTTAAWIDTKDRDVNIQTNNSGSVNVTSAENITIKGTDAKYFADYSSSYTDRSLVDKGYVDGLNTSNSDAIAAETTRAEGIESGLDSRLTTAEGNITTNANAISSETTRAEGIESGLDSRLTTAEGNISDNTDAISNEVTRATGAETTLTNNLATEVTDRTNGDATNATAISNEVSRATDAETAITNSIGAADGIAPLNASSKIDSIYLPDSILGNVSYQGTWDASGGSEPESASSGMGHYYIITVAGTIDSIDFNVGDWIISEGTGWTKVDNTDAVSSFNGRLGNIMPASGDYTASQITFIPGSSGLSGSNAQTAIIELMADLQTEITRASGAEATNATAISNENARATTAESGLNTRLTTAEGSISSLQTSTSSLSGRLDTAESRLDGLDTDVSSINGEITSIHGDITDVQSQITSLPTTLSGAGLVANGTTIDVQTGSGIAINSDAVVLDIANYSTSVVQLTATGSAGIAGNTVHLASSNIALHLNGGATLTDARSGSNSHGMEYAADYSVGFTARSLVDKAYVDSVVNSSALNESAVVSLTGYTAAGTSGAVAYLGTFTFPANAVTDADVFINGVRVESPSVAYFGVAGNSKPTMGQTLYLDIDQLGYEIETTDRITVKYLY